MESTLSLAAFHVELLLSEIYLDVELPEQPKNLFLEDR